MEYFLGSLITILIFVLCYRFFIDEDEKETNSIVRYRQSHIHELVKDVLPRNAFVKKIKRQSSKHEQKTNVKVIIVDELAYWIRDNIFYVADMDGHAIDKDTQRIVDTMGMDRIQLDKMLFIIDQLRDGEEDDSGSSRNK